MEIPTFNGHLRVIPAPQSARSLLARHADHPGVEIDRYELGLALALAMAQIVRLRRQADRWHLARRANEEAAMLTMHHHEAGAFDAGHCRVCARQAGLLDHYRRVQQEEATLRETDGWARVARRRAAVALWSSGAANRLAVVALLDG